MLANSGWTGKSKDLVQPAPKKNNVFWANDDALKRVESCLPKGRAPRAGEKFVFKKHALAIEKIAATKGKAFYRGELTAKLETAAKKQAGGLRGSDLASRHDS